MSFLFYLRWSLYHPVINLGLLFFSGGYPATLSEKKYTKIFKQKQVFSHLFPLSRSSFLEQEFHCNF